VLVLHDGHAVASRIAAYRAERLHIGFVPTMGALHAGHRALIEAARTACERVVVSIFVNPLQFGPAEDLARYPRPVAEDTALCEAAGVDILYRGSVPDFYPEDFRTIVRVRELGDTMCGAFRPGHFDGVTTVVTKLLLRVSPDIAFFGQKDYQQAVIIKRMVRDLDIPAEIRIVATVRDADGLALSSRNAYLSEREREAAPCLWRGLCAAERLHETGERGAGALRKACADAVAREPLARIQYVTLADAENLRSYADADAVRDRAVLALAVFIGATRLIDNILLPHA
jgi:pantoate--beta-alanine ligase